MAIVVGSVAFWGLTTKEGLERTVSQLTQDIQSSVTTFQKKTKNTEDLITTLDSRGNELKQTIDQLSGRARVMNGVLDNAAQVVTRVDKLQKDVNQLKESSAAAARPADPNEILTFIGGI